MKNFVTLGLGGWIACSLFATQLWGQHGGNRARAMSKNWKQGMVSPYTPSRASRVGDLITVNVKIGTAINNRDQRDLNKQTAADANGSFSATGAAGVDAAYSSDSNRQFKGQSSLREDRRLTDRFTCRVIDVNPLNGNLIIQGRRKTMVQGDERILQVSGVIRPRDITAQNEISTDYVAGFSMRYEGKGSEQNYTRQGPLMKVISKIWPF